MHPINLSAEKVLPAIQIVRAEEGESRGAARRENRAVENSLLSGARIPLFRRRSRRLPGFPARESRRERSRVFRYCPRVLRRATVRPFDGS